jgi:hypothetical protein
MIDLTIPPPKPKAIGDAWKNFQGNVIPADAPPVQAREMRRAYYAGASVAISAIVNIGEGAPINRQVRIEALLAELTEFAALAQAGKA